MLGRWRRTRVRRWRAAALDQRRATRATPASIGGLDRPAVGPVRPRRGVHRWTGLVQHRPPVTGHRLDPPRREPRGRRPQVAGSGRSARPVGLFHLLDGPRGRRRRVPDQDVARPSQLDRGRLPLPRRRPSPGVVEPEPERLLQGTRLRAPSTGVPTCSRQVPAMWRTTRPPVRATSSRLARRRPRPSGPWEDVGRPIVQNPELSLIDPASFRDPVTDKSYLLWKDNTNALCKGSSPPP